MQGNIFMATTSSIPIIDDHTVAYVAGLFGAKDYHSVDDGRIVALFQQGVNHV
jgi:hypothetical protein